MDKHTFTIETTCEEALYTLYTAEKPCFVSFTAVLHWIFSRPTNLTFKINTKDNLYGAKVFTSTDSSSDDIYLSGCAYLKAGEKIEVYATGEQAAEDDIYTTLMVINV